MEGDGLPEAGVGMGDSDYRIELDVYNGPLDLLLYLIRREEVSIYDIPVATIADQYMGYVEMLRELDLDTAGEYLVMASKLTEIKARMLLPRSGDEEEEEEDPRADLVKQLLEYKKFRDAADDLQKKAELRKQRFPRGEVRQEPTDDEKEELNLDEVTVWDLLHSFSKLMRETMSATSKTIVYDDTPAETYMERVMGRLRRMGRVLFEELFEDRTRAEIIGTFLGLLELVRLREVVVEQDAKTGEITIALRDV